MSFKAMTSEGRTQTLHPVWHTQPNTLNRTPSGPVTSWESISTTPRAGLPDQREYKFGEFLYLLLDSDTNNTFTKT